MPVDAIRIRIVIPTASLVGLDTLLARCLENTKLPILVLCYSAEIGPQIANLLARLQNPRLELTQLTSPCGKGFALQTAILDSIRSGFTHLLTFDGQDNHLVEEIPKFLAIGREHSDKLIVGRHPLRPSTSQWNRKLNEFWSRFQSGLPIIESEHDLRLYPLQPMESMNFRANCSEFEMEILVRLLWRGVELYEAEITANAEREYTDVLQSLREKLKIAVLNTLLVIISLLKTHRSPARAGLALGIGVFIGSSPFYGFHTSLVILISLLFRLNVLYMIIGAQISLPPMTPMLVWGSVWLGHKILHSSKLAGVAHSGNAHSFIHMATQHFAEWLLGSIIVGTVLGSILGVIAYFITKRMQSRFNVSSETEDEPSPLALNRSQ